MSQEFMIPKGDLAARMQRFVIYSDPQILGDGIHACVWLPERSSKCPVVINVHGGGWVFGRAEDASSAEIEYYNNAGLVFVSLEYRFIPHVTLRDMRDDLMRGYRWVLEKLSDLIGDVVDTSSISITGASAGAHLAVFLAYDIEVAGLPRPKALVLQVGVLEGRTSPNAVKNVVGEGDCDQARAVLLAEPASASCSFFGPEAEGRLRFGNALIAEGTIMDCLLGDDEDRHPIDLVSEIFPPTCLVSAGSDELVPKEQSRNFHDKLVAKGVITALFEQPGAPHSFTGFRANGPGSECWIKVLEPACSFLVHHARQ